MGTVLKVKDKYGNWVSIPAIKGETGDAGIDEIENLEAITTDGLYKHENDLYSVKDNLWDTDLSVPFKCKVDMGIPEFVAKDGTIKVEGGIGGIPLLKYENALGDYRGGTYIFLRPDNNNFSIYISEFVDMKPYYVTDVSFRGDSAENIDLSFLVKEYYTATGTGEDIFGNWALISKYFVESGLDINKVATDDCVTNALKGNKTGEAVVLADISPLGHELKVKVSGVADLSSVTVRQQGKNILAYPYHMTGDREQNGVIFTDNGNGSITANGTASGQAYYMLFRGVLPVGKYYISGTPTGVANGVTIYVANTSYSIWAEDKGNGAVFEVKKSEQIDIVINIAKGTTVPNLTFKPMLEIGAVGTEYEPYTPLITASANASGTVKGLKSIYPTTTLTTDTSGAVIDVEYNRDINKAFAEILKLVKGS